MFYSTLANWNDEAARLKLKQKFADILRPPSRLLVSEWSNKFRKLSPEANARGGGNWVCLPMQVEPMDSVLEDDVRSTVLMWAAQTAGKTEVLLNIIGYFVERDPCPGLMIQPTLDMASAWSKDRFATMVRDTAPLAKLVSDGKQKEKSNTILHKTFPGGHLTIAGANSPASLASRPVRMNLFDEVDRFPESAGREGDPIALAEKRSESFHNAVNVKTSTPTIKGESRIEKEFEESDKRYWFVPCPKCGHEQTLQWKNVIWEDGDEENAYMQCDDEDCNARWNDKERIEAIYKGRWIATAPFKGVRGYHLNGIYCLFKAKKGFKNRLHQFVVDAKTAKRKGKEAVRVWVNTFLAETFQEEADVKPDWTIIYNRREEYSDKTVPLGVRIVTAGIDIQKNRFEIEFKGFGVGEETWGLGHHVIGGDAMPIDPRHPAPYSRLESLLNMEFRREDGAILKLAAAGFDTGYAAAQRMIYDWLRPRWARNFLALKGSSQIDSEPITATSNKNKSTPGVRLFMVGTNRIKAYIYSHSSIEAHGPGFMHFNKTYTEDFFKQLFAEDSRSVFRNGVMLKVFTLPDKLADGTTKRNEGLDVNVYSRAAFYSLGAINFDYVEQLNLKTIPPAPGVPLQVVVDPRRQRKERRGGYLAGFRG